MLVLAVAAAAGLGALLRYVVDLLVQQRVRGDFPYGTLVVNITGSLLLGLTTGLAIHHGLDTTLALLLGTGLAGGYTTLSTWAWETLALAEGGELLEASANVLGSFAAGLAAGGAGLALALL
jgi:CrcB protein